MANTINPAKFYPQNDESLPEDTTNNDSKVEAPFSPGGRPEPATSPRVEIKSKQFEEANNNLTDGLEADMVMYSKFKNIRLMEEFSIHDPKAHDFKLSFTNNNNEISTQNVNQTNLEVQSPKHVETQSLSQKGFILSVLITIFTVEFAGALEIVYITPFFLKLELNEWIDATFWMFPLIFSSLLKAPISILAGHLKCQRPTLFILMIFSVIGCLIFACADDITLEGVIPWEKRRILMTWFGLLAFCFIDVANEMASLIQNKIMEDSEFISDSLRNKASLTGSIAKIFAYFCGSLQALQISFFQVLERNMDACFLFAGILMIFCMILCYFFQKPPVKGYSGSLLPKFNNLKLSHFLPSLGKTLKTSKKMRLILLSHFFAAGNIVMLSVYATSWVGQNVLRGDPEAEFHSKSIALFEEGVSWGSLALMLTSFVIMFMSYVLHQMVKIPQKKKFKTLHLCSQLLAAFALYICLFFDSLGSVFLVIPLTGFAFQTFHSVPEILAEILEEEEGVTVAGAYRRLLDITFFYAQVLMFLVVPLIFIFYPERDDNLWGMLVSATSGLLSAIFTLFI